MWGKELVGEEHTSIHQSSNQTLPPRIVKEMLGVVKADESGGEPAKCPGEK